MRGCGRPGRRRRTGGCTREWFAGLAGTGAGELYGPEQVGWLDRLEREHGNFRAALTWALERPEVGMARRLGASLWRFWLARSAFEEGAAWLRRVVDVEPVGASADLAEVWYGLGSLVNRLGDYPASQRAHGVALAIWQGLGDRRGESRTMTALAALVRREADYGRSLSLLDEALALARAEGYEAGVATALNHIGLTLTIQGRDAEAEAHFAESLAIHDRLGDRYAVSILLNNLGEIANRRGDLTGAADYYEQSLAMARELDSRDGIAAELVNLAGVRLRLGEVGAAGRLAAEAVAALRALGDVDYLAQALGMLGEAQWVAGEIVHARSSFEEALILNRRRGDRPEIGTCLEALADVAGSEGEPERAVRLVAAASALRATIGVPLTAAEREQIDESLAGWRVVLGEERLAVVWAEGRTMAAAIEEIRDAPVDVGYAFDRAGRQIAWYVGDAREIRGFTAGDLAAMRGGTFVHSHPSYTEFAEGDPRWQAGSFSPWDLMFAWEHDLRELVAVTSERTYRLRRLGGGYYHDPGEIWTEYRRVVGEVEERLQAATRAGIMSPEEAQSLGRLADEVMAELQTYFDYEVEVPDDDRLAR